MDLAVKKANNGLSGTIEIPADKSISHRAIMFSSIAKGNSIIKNFSKGADCQSTLKLFKNLGVEIEFKDEQIVQIKSTGKLIKPLSPLDCGNSGTTMRLVSGILSGQNFETTLIGDESLSKRPMKRIIEPLELMGAKIFSTDGKAPLKIVPSILNGINYVSKLASAQVKSCIILAGLNAEGITTIKEPYLSRNHSELMLKYLNANIETEPESCLVKVQKSELESKNITVCGDISSAAFFLVAASIVPNSDIILKNVGINPTRTGILDVLTKMGANITILDKHNYAGEIAADIQIKYAPLKACTISGDIIPRLIDELPVIAVLATQAEGTTIIKDALDLRNKESDRISAIVTELKKIGADIEETNDGFIIQGKTKLKGNSTVETYHDHRLAMSLYVAALICQKPLLIKEFQWVNISFAEFELLMNKITNP